MNVSPETQAYCDAMAMEAYADAHSQTNFDRLVQDAADDGRKLVTVREISAVDDIPGADLIKVATVEGWKVVVKAGEFKPGDLCVFFEVDTFLPLSDPRYAFLEKNKVTWNGIEGARLKTIRLRKQLSQGLALPLTLFPEVAEFERGITNRGELLETGTWFFHIPGSGDVTDDAKEARQFNYTGVLRVMKWEKPVSTQLAGQVKGSFPSFLRRSDQERCQNFGDEIFGTNSFTWHGLVLSQHPIPDTVPADAIAAGVAAGRMVQVGESFYHVKGEYQGPCRYEVTIKLDGSSMTAYRCKRGDELLEGVCSRNLDLKVNDENKDNSFVRTYLDSKLKDALAQLGRNLGVQGELVGEGIQGNREGLTGTVFFVYNIFDIDRQEFLNPFERAEVMEHLRYYGAQVSHVPVLHLGVTLEELNIKNMDDLLQFAVGPSLKNPVREGVVFKALDGRHSFKVISNQYLEQEK